MEFSVLCESSRGENLRLIDSFWTRTVTSSRVIMSLIDKGEASIFNAILVRSIRAQGKQNHRVPLADRKIHPRL